MCRPLLQLTPSPFVSRSSHEAMDADPDSTFKRLLERIPLLSDSPSTLGSEKSRAKRAAASAKLREALMVFVLQEASRMNSEADFESAYRNAAQALRLGEMLYGNRSGDLIDTYLEIGVSSIGLGFLKRAEKYLTMADYTVVRNPGCSSATKSKLYRALGRLYQAMNNGPQALRLLAEDVYHSSKAHGAEDARTAGGYFMMAEVFAKSGHGEIAAALREKVAVIWEARVSEAVVGNADPLDAADYAECLAQLSSIIYYIESDAELGAAKDKARVSETLAALHFMAGNFDVAREFCIRSKEGYGESDPDAVDRISDLLKMIEADAEARQRDVVSF